MSFETPLPSVRTRTTPGPAAGSGTGLFASTDIGTGQDVLHVTSPFVAVIDTPHLEYICSGCFGGKQLETEGSLKACTGCQVVKYCDKTCQAKDWRFAHSLECGIFKNLRPRILPNNARAFLRMVLRCGRKKYDMQELDAFSKLETHIREIREQNIEQWEKIFFSAKAVKAYSGTEMSEEVIVTFGVRLDINSFNLTNALYDRVGLYLHPYSALINHSCDYNSVVAFDGSELSIKAIRPIKKGEQIFISYIDTTYPFERRQMELSQRYFFKCQCSKCQKGTDAREDKFLGDKPGNPTLEMAEKKAYELMASASTSDQDPLPAIPEYESAMQCLRETRSWPITRQPYVSIRDELIVCLFAAQWFKSAFVHTAIRCILVDPVIYPHASHPIRQVHEWGLAKLAILLSQEMDTTSSDPFPLEKFDLNFNYIVYFLLHKLVTQEGESCSVPKFKQMLRKRFEEVHTEFVAGGLKPSNIKNDIQREWEKVVKLVRESDLR